MGKNEKMTSRQEKALHTKNALFTAAIDLFKEKGYQNVTVDEIAKRAGTAKGTFYIYFLNKSKVILEEFKKIDSYYDSILNQIENLPTASDKILQFTKKQLTFIKNLGLDMLRVLYINQIDDTPDDSEKILIDQKRKLFVIISDIIEKGILTGELKNTTSVVELTNYFNRSIRGLVLDWIISEASFNLVNQGMKYTENFLLNALK